jgi:hypothetical protein
MADNVGATTGPPFATDDISGVHYPRVKPVHGVDGTATETSTTTPFPTASKRQHEEITLLSSAARTSSTTSATQTNSNYIGAILKLNATVAGTGNLHLRINEGTTAIVKDTAVIVDAVERLILFCYPGLSTTNNGITGGSSIVQPVNLLLPRDWSVTVVHSDASSWTYELKAFLLG